MRKPTIFELVASGFRGGFSRNGLIAALAITLTSVLLPALAFGTGLVHQPALGVIDPAVIILQLATAVLTTLTSQPFLIGMVEHVFRQPSPITTLRVIARYWLGTFALILTGILLGIVVGLVFLALAQLGPVGRITGSLLIITACFYFGPGLLLIWPMAVYEERFSPFRAFQAMRGYRWRAFASIFLLMLPFFVPLFATVFANGPQGAILLFLTPPLGLTLLLTFAFSIGSAGSLALATHLYLSQRGDASPGAAAIPAWDATGLS
ncbi:hypothetical protein [Oleomonas cavernae]|nr:hypothetical protein [Oleomonas cavernae]